VLQTRVANLTVLTNDRADGMLYTMSGYPSHSLSSSHLRLLPRRTMIHRDMTDTAHVMHEVLVGLTLDITSPERGKGETRSSWWRVWCMALFCGQSVIAAGRIYRGIQQKTENAACERFLDLTMPGHRLRDTCRGISIPIVFTSMAYQNASTLLDRPDQISPLHGMTNSPTLRAPGICPPERSR